MVNVELEILVATFGEDGLKRLASMIASPADGVAYVVSCQCPGHDSLPIPPELVRSDVKVVFTPTKGLSINRNHAISHASAPICVISDDDISYLPGSFSVILSTFRDNPDLDFATFRHIGPAGISGKAYPSYSFSLSNFVKGYYVTSFEIAFRRENILRTGIWFNENFGLGNIVFASGEEELWIHDLLQAGLKGSFFPYDIASHPLSLTTGDRLKSNPEVLRAQGAVITRLYPLTALPRVFLKGWRAARGADRSLISHLKPLLYGWWQATFHPGRLFGKR